MGDFKIIYFDGGDGCGKTTQLGLAKQSLEQNGFKVFATRALGGTPIGESLREVILGSATRPPQTDMHIALASQYALGAELEKLQNIDVVLVDRSPLSIIAFQAYADKMDIGLAKTQVDIILSKMLPDLIIVFDADAADLKDRRIHRNRHEGTDYFESKSITYHQAVAEGYRAAAQDYSGHLIDATQSIEAVHQQTMQLITPLLKT
jgi:dTMP kinase